MTFDDYFRDQISSGHPPMVALHNAAQAYAAKIKLEYRRPDCSQYADENAAWGKQNDSEAVELLREQCQLMSRWRENGVSMTTQEISWHDRVLKFLEGKQ